MAEGPDRRLELTPELARSLVAGLVLGVVAAAIVWWLERFETRRLIGEAEAYLRKHADFQSYLRERELGEP